MAGEILVARATFQATVDGQERVIVAGKTTVRGGHPLLDEFADLFAPLAPTFEVEAATEPAPAPPASAPTPVVPAAKKAAAKPEPR